MSLPAYPEYKSSEVEWLGEIPSHWSVAPLKRGFDVYLGKMLQTEPFTDDDIMSPYLRAANIQWGVVDLTDVKSMWISPRDRVQLRLDVGDLLVSEGGDVGRSALWRGEIDECFIQNSVNRVRAQDKDLTSYLYYWMAALKAKGYIDVLCNKSTIAHFTAEKVAAVPTPYPSYEEQAAIVAFLDRETVKIDALIAEQEKLLALLAEKRQATISHAVTRGLDLNAPMKDSGIPWLGEVPAHWGIRSISSISTKITNGYVGPTRDVLVDEGVRYLQSLHIKENKIRFDSPYFVRKEWSEDHRKSILEAGDVLIVQTGDIGQSAVVTEEFAGCNCHALIIVAPIRSELDGRWLSWVLNSDYGVHSLLSIQTGALHPHLNCGNVKGVYVPLPPLPEQTQIVERINDVIDQYEALIGNTKSAISLLSERRSALIAAAVTGKIDVRGAMEAQAA
jgi:type I restriction enzyme S subunit